ncbi:MAG TPA: class I SAM-dependent methyltransferase [Candidatus Dormibacteraeota bacterium]|nr:class I SAM-dependent methyltransferase [Candidatus Dormibacteraeota bacterium]
MDANGWDRAYREGDDIGLWDTPWPSPELVGTVLGLGPAIGVVALDAGCGAGTEAVYLASLGLETIGVDISSTALAIAAERAAAAGVTLDLRLGDVRELPVEDASVDFVNDRGLLHHVPAAGRAQYAAEVARVLRPGGWLLVRGMSAGERCIPVTRRVVAATFGVDRFAEVRSSEYTMVGANGSRPGHIALLRRS